MFCYLDNAATTRPSDAAANAALACMREGYFNPSALYKPAMLAEKAMNACREEIAALLHADRVTFTSGGTESDNLAIRGGVRAGSLVLYSAGEHPAVAETCAAHARAVAIPYTRAGIVDLDALEGLLTTDVKMLCVMQVNNETGAVQPIAEIAKLRDKRAPEALLMVDGVQGFLRVPMDMRCGVDLYALSGHKIHAPKGVGALALSQRARLQAQATGGGQEAKLRSGTENTPGIAALRAAIAGFPGADGMRALKCELYDLLRESVPTLSLNGPDPRSASSAPHILNVSLPPVRSETMLHALEADGVIIGVGSACSSHGKKPSATLKAMGVPAKLAECALRFSLSPYTTREEIAFAASRVIHHYEILKKFERR